jgi:hypothetical protein
MDIILLQNGQCISRHDQITVANGKLPLRFIGAPAYSTLQIISDMQVVRRTLSSNGETVIDISQTSGNIKFKVISPEGVWQYEGVYIEREPNGSAIVMPYTNNAVIMMLSEEISTIKREISSLRAEIKTLSKPEKYQII